MAKSLDDKIIEIEQLKEEADIVAGTRSHAEDPNTQQRADRVRDIATVKSGTLKQVLDILKS